MSEKDQDMPLAAREAAEVGAPGYGTGLLSVAIIILGTGVLAFLIYLMMTVVNGIESRDPIVRSGPRPSVHTPGMATPAPASAPAPDSPVAPGAK